MLSARCKNCNVELTSNNSKTKSCGCPNMMTITSNKITAVDMDQVVLINSDNSIKKDRVLDKNDLQYQENRRNRKVRKLNYEVR